jgi:thiol-disulfide isomerase/thioredoxin
MCRVFLLTLIFLSELYAFGQKNTYIVPLTKKYDDSPFGKIIWSTFANKFEDNKFKVPFGFDKYLIKYFSIDVAQNRFERFKNSEISYEEFKSFGLDTIKVSKTFFNHKVFFFVGKKQDKKYVIVDTNFDRDFTNEKIYIFNDSKLKIKMSDSLYRTLPSVFISGLYVPHFSTKTQFYLSFRLQPFPLFFSSYTNNLEQDLYLDIVRNEYCKGYFNVGFKKYDIAIGSPMGLPIHYNIYNKSLLELPSEVMIKHSENKYNVSNKTIVYRIKDTIKIDNYSFIINNVESTCKNVEIKNIYSKTRKVGINEGDVSPNIVLNSEGKEIQIFPTDSKFILLDFWGTWCKPCIDAIPEVKKLSTIPNLRLISIAYEFNESIIYRQFLSSHQIDWENYRILHNNKQVIDFINQ